MSLGIWKGVLTFQTHSWLTLKMAKSSGLMLFTSEVYAMERAQPFKSSWPYMKMNKRFFVSGEVGLGLTFAKRKRSGRSSQSAKEGAIASRTL